MKVVSPYLRASVLQRSLLLALFLTFATSALAQGRVECAAVKSAILHREVRYCAILPPSYDRDKTRKFPILYYLHGLGENEQALTGPLWDVIDDLQQKHQIGEFLMVTPDGDRSFYINSHDGRYRYEDFFIREFLPAIERKYRVAGTRARRGIAGTSMGGYGALRFAFKYPQLFSVVTAEMPALYEKFPPQLIALVKMSERGRQMGDLFGDPFDQAFWQRNTPFTLAREHAARLRRLKIYFDCGDQDDYGFDDGARQLDKLLTSLKLPHESHIYPGRHDATYIAAHIDAVLKF
ncbi:MAG TPA: alpha/beta hydrolase family protein, partial [Terriglobales bacterium]|nr:alpha/beta hydrolase family protein [Terriglobales bacterium]